MRGYEYCNSPHDFDDPQEVAASESKPLLPCPFCGGTNLESASNSAVSDYIICLDCGAEGPPADDRHTAWNTRAR